MKLPGAAVLATLFDHCVFASPAIAITLFLAIGLPRLLPRQRFWRRAVWASIAFAIATIAVLHFLGSPFDPHQKDNDGTVFWVRLIEAAWWLTAAELAIFAVRLVVALENKPHETRIIVDLLAGAIKIASVLCIFAFAFGVPIRGMLATSGVIAIVLGLALQNTLADVFSGIAVGLERAYKSNDHLWVEGDIEGRVVQISWRTTQISTFDGNLAIIPNSVMAKARLVNRSEPTERRGDSISIVLDVTAVPSDCISALTAAALGCTHLLVEPRPRVACTGLTGVGATYRIDFSVPSSECIPVARTELFSQIHRHLRHAGVALTADGVPPPPIRALSIEDLLDRSDWFGVLEKIHRSQLAERFTLQSFQEGELLVDVGKVSDALFVVSSGTIRITRDDPESILHRMGPGETLGAVALITGEASAITATAVTMVSAFRISREQVREASEADPELRLGLERLADRGLAVLRRGLSPVDDAKLAHPHAMLARFRAFLRTLQS